MNLSEQLAKELGLLILIAFFLGAIPCGYIVGRIWGVDVRKAGSKNIGATNVNRVVGKTAGGLTLILDMLKGILATYIPAFLTVNYVPHPDAICGICAVLGHCYSPFMGGKGGKGVATALGVFLSLTPLITFCAVLLFCVVIAVTQYVSLASLSGVWFLVVMLATKSIDVYPKEYLWGAILVAVIITYRHSENIRRLRAKVENKVW